MVSQNTSHHEHHLRENFVRKGLCDYLFLAKSCNINLVHAIFDISKDAPFLLRRKSGLRKLIVNIARSFHAATQYLTRPGAITSIDFFETADKLLWFYHHLTSTRAFRCFRRTSWIRYILFVNCNRWKKSSTFQAYIFSRVTCNEGRSVPFY